jgi:hypothetical protein
MECPNCGFVQPEEDYCANCGAHIPKALTRRRRRTVIALLATVVCIGAAASGAVFWASRHPIPASPSAPAQEGSGPSIQRMSPPSSSAAGKPAHKAAVKKPSRSEGPKAGKRSSETTEAPPPPQVGESSSQDRAVAKAESPAEAGPSEKDLEGQIKRWAAEEWMARGRDLADYSQEELAFYRKALEADPNLALAHYRIGLIQWKWGLRDPALDAFRQFWRHATKEEREKYPLPAGFTPEELAPQEGREAP